MREDLSKDLLPVHGEAIDPVEMARRDLRKSLPKRFYTQASIAERDGSFALLLDGHAAHTPARTPIALASRAAAELVQQEWQAQLEHIDPATMPITRIVHSALDGVVRDMAAVREEILRYAGSDLICYRAVEPEGLARMQALLWDPVLAFAQDELGAGFVLAQGVMFTEQPDHALAAVRRAVDAVEGAVALACLNVMTTLTGSAMIPLALIRGRLDLQGAWAATHADEDFQMQIWGADAEAVARRDRRFTEMKAAADLFAAMRG